MSSNVLVRLCENWNGRFSLSHRFLVEQKRSSEELPTVRMVKKQSDRSEAGVRNPYGSSYGNQSNDIHAVEVFQMTGTATRGQLTPFSHGPSALTIAESISVSGRVFPSIIVADIPGRRTFASRQ